MAVAVRALPALPLVMVVVVGVVSYAAALVVVGGWTRLESDLVRSVLATFRPAHRAPAIGAGRPS